MHWLILNLPFMIFATALILAVVGVGLYLDARTEEARRAAMAKHPSVVTKIEAEAPVSEQKPETVG